MSRVHKVKSLEAEKSRLENKRKECLLSASEAFEKGVMEENEMYSDRALKLSLEIADMEWKIFRATQ